jgi:hypothetical protein
VKRLAGILVRAGMRRGWRLGVVEGNQAWVIIGGAALLSHLAGRALGREEETVFREALKPGESFRITHLPKP